jgi:glutathione S-transferase
VLELWHEWNSVHSFKVRVVLAEKQLEWVEHRVELLKFEHLTPKYLALNPHGVVPTLAHDGRVVLESSVICQYLDECFPQPALMPAEPYARAQARLWLKHFDERVHPAIRAASFQLLYRPQLARLPRAELAPQLAAHPDPARARTFLDAACAGLDREAVRGAITEFRATLECLGTCLEKQHWLTGASFGLADAAMAPFAERLEQLGLRELLRAIPSVAQWSAAVLSRHSVRAAAAPAEHRLAAPAGSDLSALREICQAAPQCKG